MDIKVKVEELVDKIKGDKNLASKFQKDPTRTVSDLVGVELPKDKIEPIVDAIKSKLKLEKVTGLLGRK